MCVGNTLSLSSTVLFVAEVLDPGPEDGPGLASDGAPVRGLPRGVLLHSLHFGPGPVHSVDGQLDI